MKVSVHIFLQKNRMELFIIYSFNEIQKWGSVIEKTPLNLEKLIFHNQNLSFKSSSEKNCLFFLISKKFKTRGSVI